MNEPSATSADTRKFVECVSKSNNALVLSHCCNIVLIYQYMRRKESLTLFQKVTSVLGALYVADLVSGLAHLTFDRDTDYPFFKKNISDFQNHHLNPTLIKERSVLELFRQSTFTPFNAGFVLYNLTKYTSKPRILSQLIFLYACHLTQMIHMSAHKMNHATRSEKRKLHMRLLNMLQQSGILLKPEDHKIHHSSPKFDVNFCLINGWANPLLNKIVHIPRVYKWLFSSPLVKF